MTGILAVRPPFTKVLQTHAMTHLTFRHMKIVTSGPFRCLSAPHEKSCDNNGRGVMTITLRPEHEKVVTQAIQSGAYQSPEEVIERALEMLRSEDTWLLDHKDEIAGKL